MYTTGNLLDYETTSTVTLVILGQDNPVSGLSNSASASVVVTVKDINEPPVFLNNPTIQISENSTPPINIYWYNGTDQDAFVLYGIARYDIVSGEFKRTWNIYGFEQLFFYNTLPTFLQLHPVNEVLHY